ncbi:MAG: AAA family ATPase [Clostridia bacterium]|nr:AAA family ATPase [Clostridia bacterium]
MEEIINYLPGRCRKTIMSFPPAARAAELRLRVGRCASLSVFRNGSLQNVALPFVLTEEESREMLSRLCRGSVYAYAESLAKGFIPLEGGVRVGLAGKAVRDGGKTVGMAEISAYVFRFPLGKAPAECPLYDLFCRQPRNILLYGPPGCGKTTALREFSRRISSGKEAKRTVVADERMEWLNGEGDLLDTVRGFPKGEALELAVRLLSPEVLVTDEIGSSDISAMETVLQSGVPLVASAHGGTVEDLLARRGVGDLIRQGFFPLLLHSVTGEATRYGREEVG